MRHVVLTTPTQGTVGHLKVSTSCVQTVHKFEVCSFSRTKDISWGVKFKSWSRDHDHALFKDGLSPTGWDMLRQTKPPNFKWLTSPVTEI